MKLNQISWTNKEAQGPFPEIGVFQASICATSSCCAWSIRMLRVRRKSLDSHIGSSVFRSRLMRPSRLTKGQVPPTWKSPQRFRALQMRAKFWKYSFAYLHNTTCLELSQNFDPQESRYCSANQNWPSRSNSAKRFSFSRMSMQPNIAPIIAAAN
jgi:hypothetical protein